MTIVTRTEYEATKSNFTAAHNEFLAIYNDLMTRPCIKYKSDSKGLDKKCLDEIWKQSGCTTSSPYMEDAVKDKTMNDIITDAYNWATNTDVEHRTKCYGTATTGFRTSPKDFNINKLELTLEPGKSFKKDGVGINFNSLADCKNSCLPGSGCISATYNSTQKKCWSNTGTYSSLEEPTTSDAADTAIYYKGFQLLNQLDEMQKELTDYETKHKDDDKKSNNDKKSKDDDDKTKDDEKSSHKDKDKDKDKTWNNDELEESMLYNDSKFAKLEKKINKIEHDRAEMQKMLEQYRKDLSGTTTNTNDASNFFSQPMTEENKRILIYVLIGIVSLIGIFVLYKLVMMVSGMFGSSESSSSEQMGGGGKFLKNMQRKSMKMVKGLFKK